MATASYTGRDNLEAMQEAHRYNEHLLNLVRNVLRPGDVVVDFGAGIGTFARVLTSEGHTIHCVEPDLDQAALIHSAGLPVHTSAQDLPAGGADVIYSFNVLEHIENDAALLAELFLALKPGGRFIVYVPAFPVLFTSMDRKVGHFRRYKRADLRSKLELAGFEVCRINYADSAGFFATLLFRVFGSDSGDIAPGAVAFYDRWVFPVSVAADKVLSGVLGKNLAAIARKPTDGR
jgi:SAM-dependent methyltransferase